MSWLMASEIGLWHCIIATLGLIVVVVIIAATIVLVVVCGLRGVGSG